MAEHKSLAEALAAFQGEAPKLHKGNTAKVESKRTGRSYTYKYLDLADIVEVIQPVMARHGLSFSAFPATSPDGRPALRYTLRHAAGDVESDLMPLMLPEGADAQALGSAISYGRRYALCAVLNLVADEDDDGAAARAATERHRPTVDFRAAAAGLKAGQIREAFIACGLEAPGGEVPAWQLFDNVPAGKAELLAEALRGTERR